MSSHRPVEFLIGLVTELSKLPAETEWLEFKVDHCEPADIGEYLSALANSAALAGKAFAYLVWGVTDHEHLVVGTNFRPQVAKVGNEELENWLLRLLTPKVHFQFFEVPIDGVRVVLLEIDRAAGHPVQFQGQEYVRVGTYKKKLKDFPERERKLWRLFDQTPFEEIVAADRMRSEDVLRVLDYPSYFELLERPLPENRDGILNALESDGLVRVCAAGGWNVTNLGAVLFAKRLEEWPSLRRKAIRVIQYRGASRVETVREQVGNRGYASGFEGLIGFVNGLLPSNEVVEQALRKTVPRFPELAVRELVANALIHQDFFVTGAGPMVEIFEDRIEVSNPGQPLVEADRFVDTPPRSRNEALASLMRRIGVCEERGSGWDKVVFQTEFYQLPAPLAEVPDGSTRVVLFAPRPLSAMDKADRVRTVYLHACLRYVNREYLTNTSLRQRFGIEPQNLAVASRLIREAVEAGVILPYDANAAPKLMRYVPVWAGKTATT
jgi:predicted HTH transcriptional regulator